MRSIYFTFLIFAFLAILCPHPAHSAPDANQTGDCRLILFYSDTCPHCHDERVWLEAIRLRYPSLEVLEYESGSNDELFSNISAEHGTNPVGVPMTFINGMAFVGFSGRDGLLVYRNKYGAYSGSANQIENSITGCIQGGSSNVSGRLIEISLTVEEVKKLLEVHPASLATRALSGETYLVAWWSPERLSSKLAYPDLIVYVDKETGAIIKAEEPKEALEILPKPGQGVTWIHLLILSVIALYLMAYLVLQKRRVLTGKQWIYGFVILAIIFLLTLYLTMPADMIGGFFRDFFGLYL